MPNPAQLDNSETDRREILRSIRDMMPLRHLSNGEFATITREMQVEYRAAGADFFSAERDGRFIFYLVSGEITIVDADGNRRNVVSGSTESQHPLAPHARASVKAIAHTPMCFVRFPADLMRLDAEAAFEPVIVDELTQEDEALDKRVLFEVYHNLLSDEFVLPTLPDVALRIREAANNENTSVEDVASVIRADPSTAAYCIGAANNAAHAGASQVDNVLDAVVRMGIQPTRDIVVAYTMRSLFNGTDRLSKKLMRDAWMHSCRIAALSYILARDVAKLNPERALLAGLLHDIGITVVVNEAQNHLSAMQDVLAFNEVCHALSGQIGAMVLRAWKFPDIFPEAAMEAESFTRIVSDRLGLADVVMLAHLHDEQPAPWSLKTSNLPELDIHKKIGAEHLTEDCRLAVIEQAEQELTELTRLLIS